MKLDEALVVAKWERVTASHLQPGCYVVWDVATQTFRKVWPNGDGCTFIVHEGCDDVADWKKVSDTWVRS